MAVAVLPVSSSSTHAKAAVAAPAASVEMTVTMTPASQPVDAARERAATLRAALAETRKQVAASVARYEAAEDALGEAVNASVALTRELEGLQDGQRRGQAAARARIASLYKAGGGTALLASVMTSRDPQDLFARAANVSAVVRLDLGRSSSLGGSASQLAVLERRARANTVEKVRLAGVLDAETAKIERLLAEQQAALDSADATVKRLVEQERERARAEAARRLATRASSSGGVDAVGDYLDAYAGPPGACPVGAVHSFVDTWHAPRSGGRLHQGTDVFAPKGSDAYAVVDGVVDKVGDGGLGGITLWIRGDNGDRYYYAHNDARFVTLGQRVRAGQVVASVGNSGNAETTPAHIHFEARPGGGAAANPYSWLAALCAG